MLQQLESLRRGRSWSCMAFLVMHDMRAHAACERSTTMKCTGIPAYMPHEYPARFSCRPRRVCISVYISLLTIVVLLGYVTFGELHPETSTHPHRIPIHTGTTHDPTVLMEEKRTSISFL